MASILYNSTSEAQARLVGYQGEKAVPGFKLTREWPHIDATVADTLVVTLKAAGPYTNVKADGQTYSGTFVNSLVTSKSGEEDNDRQVTITQEVTLVQDLADNDDLTAATALFEYIDEDINKLTYSDWIYAHQMIKLIIPNVNPASLAGLADRVSTPTPAITEAQWAAKATTLLSSQIGGTSAWEFQKLDAKKERDGTLTVNVILADPDFETTNTESAKETIILQNEGDFGETRVEVIKGKDIEAVVATLSNLAADTDRVINRKSWVEGEPGEAIITKQQQVSDDYDTTAAPRLILDQEATATLPKTIVATWFRTANASVAGKVTEAQASANWPTWFGASITAANGFVYKQTGYSPNGDGTTDVTMTIWVPRTKSYVAPSITTKYDLQRSELKITYKKPTQAGLVDNPEEGFYWRINLEYFSCRWTSSQSNAKTFSDEGLFGSFSRFMPSSGLFYAEKVTDRVFGQWKDTLMEDETAALGQAGITGLAFDVP